MAERGAKPDKSAGQNEVPDLSALAERAQRSAETEAVHKMAAEALAARGDKSQKPEVQRAETSPGAADAPQRPEVRRGEAQKPEAPSNPSDAGEKSRINYLQQTLNNLLPAYAADKPASVQAAEKSDLQKEMSQQKFGPATKELYGNYVQWLQDKALPKEIGRQLALGMTVPPSAHFAVNPDGQVKLDVPIDRAPSDAQMEKLDGAYHWLAASIPETDKREQALVADMSKSVETAVRTLGLPKEWLIENGQPGDHWLENSSRMLGSALQVREYVELLDDLKKSSGSDFPGDMPPGSTLSRDSKGRITTINLDWPKSWKLDNEADREKLEKLEKWVADKKELLEPIKKQLGQLHFYPELVPSQDDLETKDRGVQFDASGRIASVVDLKGATASGVNAQHFNLASSRFNVEQKDGKVVMTQTVQLKDVPVWGYLNSIGVSDVGKPMVMTREYKPDDYVVVRKGHEFELVQARNLRSDGTFDSVKRAGEKVLPAAMDAGMFALGATEVVASLRRGQTAPLLNVLRGVTRTAVGGTGVFNNAGARETEWGSNLNLARSTYFIADVGYGVGRGSYSYLQKAWQSRQAVVAAETVVASAAESSLLRGGAQLSTREAAAAGVAADGIATNVAARAATADASKNAAGTAAKMRELSTMIDGGALGLTHKTGNVLLGTAAVGYTPYIASDLVNQGTRLSTDPTQIIQKQARRRAQDGPAAREISK